MSIKDDFYIKEIDYNTAENVVVKCHYAHRKANCVYAFGLFQKSPLKLVGVVIYGIPASPSLCKGICGESERNNIYELSRLYVDDGLPRNLESFLVGNTLKLLDREIIVSFADTHYNHFGVVYQATNFIYTGLSAIRTDVYSGDKHLRHAKGDKSIRQERSRKHRYIYFNCSRKRKKQLLEKLNYPILPYPKSDKPCPITSKQNINDNKKKSLF